MNRRHPSILLPDRSSETAVLLTEVAPKIGPRVAKFWAHIKGANEQANPELIRLALKLATGAGKTTVIAMLIAWQTVNAVRHPNSKQFSSRFLIVSPGITIRDRLRVLMPNDPESYYRNDEITPPDMLRDIHSVKIVITNYHAFKLREKLLIAKGTRQALEGWRGDKVQPPRAASEDVTQLRDVGCVPQAGDIRAVLPRQQALTYHDLTTTGCRNLFVMGGNQEGRPLVAVDLAN